MRRISIIILTLFIGNNPFAQTYPIPDSAKILSYYNQATIQKKMDNQRGYFIASGFEKGQLGLHIKNKKKKSIIFSIWGKGHIVTGKGENISVSDDTKGTHALWNYDLKMDNPYSFFVNALPDSASNTTTYTAYFFAPELNAWKLISAIRAHRDGGYLRKFYSSPFSSNDKSFYHNGWVSDVRGRVTKLNDSTHSRSTINYFRNIDSAALLKKDIAIIKDAINKKTIDTTGSVDGVWYKIIKEGSGAVIEPTDTVTAFYKGWILNGEVFDSTKTEPAVFPLIRLIRGWQIGLTKCKVGGKIRLIIPSTLAYSIRTRAYKIPPNSILVFDIEVLNSVKKRY